jgi:hypothetical protein
MYLFNLFLVLFNLIFHACDFICTYFQIYMFQCVTNLWLAPTCFLNFLAACDGPWTRLKLISPGSVIESMGIILHSLPPRVRSADTCIEFPIFSLCAGILTSLLVSNSRWHWKFWHQAPPTLYWRRTIPSSLRSIPAKRCFSAVRFVFGSN